MHAKLNGQRPRREPDDKHPRRGCSPTGKLLVCSRALCTRPQSRTTKWTGEVDLGDEHWGPRAEPHAVATSRTTWRVDLCTPRWSQRRRRGRGLSGGGGPRSRASLFFWYHVQLVHVVTGSFTVRLPFFYFFGATFEGAPTPSPLHPRTKIQK